MLIQNDPDRLGFFFLEEKRGVDFQILQIQRGGSKSQGSRGQGQFNESSGRENGDPADPVIRKKGMARRIQMIFPGEMPLLQAIAEKRMLQATQ